MKQMTKEELTDAVSLYFKTLADFGRTPSSDIGPKDSIIEKESQFLKYLDMVDLQCWFCNFPLVVIQIDYRTQRPVWGCREDIATKGLQKIKWSNHCGDCGVFLNLSKDLLVDQEKYMDNGNSCTVCDRCIGNGNILTQDEVNRVVDYFIAIGILDNLVSHVEKETETKVIKKLSQALQFKPATLKKWISLSPVRGKK